MYMAILIDKVELHGYLRCLEITLTGLIPTNLYYQIERFEQLKYQAAMR